jgi:hypothetical protein
MRRVLRYDGLLPNKLEPDGSIGEVTPADVRAMATYVAKQRAGGPFDVVVEGRTPGDDPEAAAAVVRPYAEAGATWWLDAMWTAPNGIDDVRVRLRQGPPRLA